MPWKAGGGGGGNARWVRIRTVSNEKGPEARPDRDQNLAGLVQCQWFDCSLLCIFYIKFRGLGSAWV